MPELSQNFIKGRMNKDLDERLVTNGEYRDALNIEVSTSEGANVGTVQTTMGNTKVGTGFGTCVASITDEKNDDIYWLVAGSSTDGKDAVLKYHLNPSTNTYEVTPVVVDVWKQTRTIANSDGDVIVDDGTDHLHISNLGNSNENITNVRKGMVVTGTFTNNTGSTCNVLGTSIANGATYTLLESHGVIVDKVRTDYPTTNSWRIYLKSSYGSTTYTLFPSKIGDDITFISGSIWGKEDRVLNFDSSRLITGINIIDDLMFWTDNHTEPKKINIPKCIDGTLDINTHTTFEVIDVDGNNYTIPSSTLQNSTANFPLKKEHITVVKKSPLTAPKLEMDDTEVARGQITAQVNTMFTDGTDNLAVNTVITYQLSDFLGGAVPDWRVGDIILSTSDNNGVLLFEEAEVRLSVTNVSATAMTFEIISITSTQLGTSNSDHFFVLERSAPLFEFKFPRFSYRYKYQDGEYSSFAPFSKVAFMPGPFDYNPKKGYNLGMKNQLRNLKVKDFIIEDSIRPHGVIAVDILYKESNSPNIYTVKTINTVDDEWSADGTNPNASGVLTRGSVEITSELIHAVLPANQLLRPWDNVPRKALAQDISSNRLIYGNYLQNFNLTMHNGNSIKFMNQLSLDSKTNSVGPTNPQPSIKSLRTYQVGVVYRDEHGRETPVIASKRSNSGTITIKKDVANKQNKLKVHMEHDPPGFADSFKFFVKETSNEYYNLAMDRWYNAEDGNVWLSFPSAERNKIDEETYLILKKQHDTDVFVSDEARYKVIAIENEVPEYVKLTKKSLGTLGNNSDRTVFGTAGGGYPEKDVQFFYVNKDTLESGGLKDFDTNGGDVKKYCRFLSTGTKTYRSDWYEIRNARKIEVNNTGKDDTWMIETTIPFGKDLNFTTEGSTGIGTGLWADRIGSGNSYNTSTLKLEIAKEIEEVKPEHRGRFFVKVYKDGVLEKHVLKSVNADRDWISVFSEPIYYLNSTSWKTPRDWGANEEVPSGSVTNAWWAGTGTVEAKVKRWWRNFGSHWFIDNLQTRTNSYTTFYGGAPDADVDGPNGTTAGGITALGNQHSKTIHLAFSGIYIPGSKPKPQNVQAEHNHEKKTKANLDLGVNANLDEKTWVDYITSVGTVFKWSKDPEGVKYVVEKATLYKSGARHNENHNTSSIDELTNYDADSSALGGMGGENFLHAANKRIRWEIQVGQWDGQGSKPTDINPAPGVGVLSALCTVGYNPISNTVDNYTDPSSPSTISRANHHDNAHPIEILELEHDEEGDFSSTNPAIWETEPKEDIGLELYYEASDANPIELDYRTNEVYIPVTSKLTLPTGIGPSTATGLRTWTTTNNTYTAASSLKTTAFNDKTITINDRPTWTDPSGNTGTLVVGDEIIFTKPDGGMVTGIVDSAPVNVGNTYSNIKLDDELHKRTYYLDWFNCYSFGNGVESNRIRDDFNAVTIDKGPIVSTTLATPYEEERKKNGLIYSGIYNSTSGINDLNQFIMAEKITKDVSPRFGSIQKLHARDTDLVVFCEDKVVRCLANKDAVYNADGNAQLIATNRVLGQVVPFAGEYGISTNPESFASRSFQAYFSDRVRGVVMRLSRDGLTAVSEHGMKDWFSDNLKQAGTIIGSYDDKKSLYNITLKNAVTKAVEVDRDTSIITHANTNPIGYFIPTNNPPSAIGSIKYTQVDDDNNYQTGGGTLDLVTQIVLPTTGYYEDRSTELQSLISALDECPNGTIYLHYQVQHDTPSQEVSSTYTDSGAPIITYTVNSYTFNDNGAYILDVDYHSGTYAMLDFVYFWWSSENCDDDTGGEEGEKNNFVERTLSFAEKTNGWVSFKSWIQESGLSMNGKFYTFSSGNLYEHEKNELRNNFYGTQYTSTVDVLLNEQPSSVKSFQLLKYSGSQARITKNILTGTNSDGYNQFDNEYYNNIGKTGWYASSIETDLQSGKELEFRPKEGKWFTAMQGVSTYFNSATDNNVDEGEFSVQGIGYTASVHCPDCGGEDPRQPSRDTFTLTVKDDPTDH